MLFAQPKPALHSNNGSIEMVYQGSMTDLDLATTMLATAKASTETQEEQPPHQSDDTELAKRVKQELHVGERRQPTPAKNSVPGHLQPDPSSSELTDILKGASPREIFNGNFRMQCPSAVPSPLAKLHGPHTALQPMNNTGDSPAGPWTVPRTPKTMDDHFYMTNEHLDVVGKTTYDALDMYSKQQISTTNAKHEHLVILIEKHFEGLKSQVSSVNEKADRASEKTHNVARKLDQLERLIKDDVIGTMTEQTKKVAILEVNLKEIQKAMLHLQETVEKLSEVKSGLQRSASSALPTPGAPSLLPHVVTTHHSHDSPASYYGHTSEAGRDDQPSMPPLEDRSIHNYEAHHDPRGSYGNNWQSQAWNGRSTYQARSKEDRPSYSGTNPYHFGNGAQYNNGYVNGYSSYNFSPGTPEQPCTYVQKPAQG